MSNELLDVLSMGPSVLRGAIAIIGAAFVVCLGLA